MKYQKGDLIKFDEFHPRLRLHPRLRPHLHPHLNLRPYLRLEKGDLGVVCEAIHKTEAWENFEKFNKEEQKQIQNCYVIYWQKQNEKCLMYENEIQGTAK